MDTLNNTNIKNKNRFEIIKYLYKNKDVNRKQLANDLNLTGAAITKIINNMIENNIITEENYFSKTRNRKARYLKIREEKNQIIVLHFKRKSSKIAILDICGKIIFSKSFSNNINNFDIELIKAMIKIGLDNTNNSAKLLSVICITPGIQKVINKNNKLKTSPYYWNLAEIKEFVENDLKIPFISQNDSNCALMGEIFFGCAKESNNTVLYNIGEGIGASALLNGHLLKSYNNGSIEIGHISINQNGPLCPCGNRGCLELYTSIYDWNNKLKKELQIDRDNLMEEMFLKYKNNNIVAKKYINEYSKHICEGAIILTTLFSPQQLVLTNNEANYIIFNPIIKTIKEEIKKRMYQINDDRDLIICESTLKDDGFLLGTIIFTLSYYFDNDLF